MLTAGSKCVYLCSYIHAQKWYENSQILWMILYHFQMALYRLSLLLWEATLGVSPLTQRSKMSNMLLCNKLDLYAVTAKTTWVVPCLQTRVPQKEKNHRSSFLLIQTLWRINSLQMRKALVRVESRRIMWAPGLLSSIMTKLSCCSLTRATQPIAYNMQLMLDVIGNQSVQYKSVIGQRCTEEPRVFHDTFFCSQNGPL